MTVSLLDQFHDARNRASKARYEGRLDNASYWDGKAESLIRKISRLDSK